MATFESGYRYGKFLAERNVELTVQDDQGHCPGSRRTPDGDCECVSSEWNDGFWKGYDEPAPTPEPTPMSEFDF